MRTNREPVTMDGNEAKLLDRYEAQFGETPPIAFLDPQTSKRLMMDAIRNNRPINEKDLRSTTTPAILRAAQPVRRLIVGWTT
jgi:hypothetical protein